MSMGPFGAPILVAGPPRTATSWTAKVLSCAGLVRYAREPVFQGKPSGYDASLDNVFLEADDEHAALNRVWTSALSLRTRLRKRWVYSESGALVRRVPVLPARMLVKEVNASLSLAWLERSFGFRIAITVRHPCGFWASALKLRALGHDTLSLSSLLNQQRLMAAYFAKQEPWLRSLEAEDERLLAAYCMILRVLELQQRAKPGWVLCRHEDSCANPKAEFERICAALDLPFSEKAQRFIDASSSQPSDETYGLSRNSALEAGKWKLSLPRERIETALAIMERVGVESYG